MVVDWGMTDKKVIKEKSNDSCHKRLVRNDKTVALLKIGMIDEQIIGR